jgi:hypothetical protein
MPSTSTSSMDVVEAPAASSAGAASSWSAGSPAASGADDPMADKLLTEPDLAVWLAKHRATSEGKSMAIWYHPTTRKAARYCVLRTGHAPPSPDWLLWKVIEVEDGGGGRSRG